jgi:hypothetical protein
MLNVSTRYQLATIPQIKLYMLYLFASYSNRIPEIKQNLKKVYIKIVTMYYECSIVLVEPNTETMNSDDMKLGPLAQDAK